MAAELGYGQPMGGIAQTAFIVPDLQAAIGRWVADMRAGPFFVLPHFLVLGQTYRGEESRADITIAMGFAGHMLIELIQPLDSEPSVYKETIELRGYGFHHLGIACADVGRRGARFAALRKCVSPRTLRSSGLAGRSALRRTVDAASEVRSGGPDPSACATQ